MEGENMKKMLITALIVLLVAGVVAISGCTSNSNSTSTDQTPPIQVTKNFTVTSSGYGFWDIDGQITPTKDLGYLEMVAVWYDSSGAVIERDPLLWNMNEVKANQAYNIHGSSSLYEKGTPARVELFFFDSVFSGADTSDAIYSINLTLS
jgi:hypothetical protein